MRPEKGEGQPSTVPSSPAPGKAFSVQVSVLVGLGEAGVERDANLLMKQALLAPSFSFCIFLLHSAFLERKEVRALLLVMLWLKGMLWLVDLLSRPQKLSPYQQIDCWAFFFFFDNPCLQWSGTCNFLQEPLLCLHNFLTSTRSLALCLSQLSTSLPRCVCVSCSVLSDS